MAAKSRNKSYMGNPNLPTANSTFEYTPEMVMEIEKCKTDIIHFASNYFYIIDPDSDVGKINIQLYDFQKRVLQGIFDNRYSIILSPRQASKTTLMTIISLHEACFKPYRNVVIVANKEATAIEIFRRVRLAYEELPLWLKPGVEEYGKTGCVFDNGSRISISTTTGSASRGQAVSVLVLDELAFIECVAGNTLIKVKNKHTGKISEVTVKDFIDYLSKKDK